MKERTSSFVLFFILLSLLFMLYFLWINLDWQNFKYKEGDGKGSVQGVEDSFEESSEVEDLDDQDEDGLSSINQDFIFVNQDFIFVNHDFVFPSLVRAASDESQAEASAPINIVNEIVISSSDDSSTSNDGNSNLSTNPTPDNAPPISSIRIRGDAGGIIEERVINGSFEDGLAEWSVIGEVNLISGSENGVEPLAGTQMVRIGSDNSDIFYDGNSVDVNILSQEIDHLILGEGLSSVGFWYNFMTYEDGWGFDEPGLMVFVGDRMVHQVWAGDVTNDFDFTTLDSTGWRYISINLAQVTDPTISLVFYSGNTGDLSRQSFVYLDGVTSLGAVANDQTVFEITVSDDSEVAEINYSYLVAGEPVVETSLGNNPFIFSLTAQPDDGLVEYWAVDSSGNEELRQSFQLEFDDVAPGSINDLTIYDDGDGDFTLEWSAVFDDNPFGLNKPAEYDLRYSLGPISLTIGEEDWKVLDKPGIINIDGLPGGSLRAPLVEGGFETYSVHLDQGKGDYYFALRARDTAGNYSQLTSGSIASSGFISSTEQYFAGMVIVNEVMWMGSKGLSGDEWIELKNMTDQNIDISGWIVENLGSSSDPDLILPAGSVVSANDYFVIANLDQASSNLAIFPDLVESDLVLTNSGEQLVLTNAAGLVIDETPPFDWPAGENGVDKKSMERNNDSGLGIAIDGSDPSSWHSCDSSSCADARSLYWEDVGSNYGTPGGDNLSFSERQIETTVEILSLESGYLNFKVTGVQAFDIFEYRIEYQRLEDEKLIKEAVVGNQKFEPNTRVINSNSIYLGTCSTQIDSCVQHQHISDITIEITLNGTSVAQRKVVTKRDFL